MSDKLVPLEACAVDVSEFYKLIGTPKWKPIDVMPSIDLGLGRQFAALDLVGRQFTAIDEGLGRQFAAIAAASQIDLPTVNTFDTARLSLPGVARQPEFGRMVAQLAGTDRISAAFGQTLLAQQRIADMVLKLPDVGPASAAFTQHEQRLSDLFDVGVRMSQQMSWLTDHGTALLTGPALRVNRAWRSATTSRLLLDHPDTVLDFGLSAAAVNRTAYTIETNEAPTGEIWYVARVADSDLDATQRPDVDGFVAWLEETDSRLARKYKGAWHAIGQRGPDWMSQGANSGIELLDWTLRNFAPEDKVLAWRKGTGMYADEVSTVNGKPRRSLRCRYVAHERGLPAAALNELLSGVSQASKDLQKIKHADDDAMAEALRSSLIAVEYCLVIMWRGV